ncbi:alpha/beta hydrolase [Rhodococcus sp. NPDC058514]|uniref:alpha/beta hydrolase n=1 Tax=unclassified Rhodococcus (in: high G+C Gram-positive bacteria) TaxID=192944 RepID=UPI0036618F8E
MELTEVSVGDVIYTVRLDGPESAHVVLLLPGAGEDGLVFDAVCGRLHDSDLRTVVPDTIDGLDVAGVLALLDGLGLAYVNLAGNREGAALAWELAARTFGRFKSLVVADSAHPAVAGGDCPAVEIPTTVLVGGPDARPDVDASSRHCYSDFRVVELGGIDSVPGEAAAAMATEISLRTSMW